MLAISRALLLRPSLLLLDEPSFGLAPLIVAEIFRILREINRNDGVSILIVEQNANLALDLADPRLSDRDGRPRDRRPGGRHPQRRFRAPRLSRLLRRKRLVRIPASTRFRPRARRRLRDHGACAGDDLPGDATGEFRPRRDGDVLDLSRLGDARFRPALLDRLRRHGGALLPRRRRRRAPRRAARSRSAPILASVIVFIGLSFIFNALAGWFFGYSDAELRQPVHGPPLVRQRLYVRARIWARSLVTFVVLALVYALLPLHAARARDARGGAEPGLGRLVGVRVGWMLALGWGLAAAIGAIAGMMAAPIVYLDPNMMGGVLLYAFAGAVLGGIDNPWGAVVGGFVVGVLENLLGAYVVGEEVKLSVALVIIVGVLVVKPSGLFGRRIVARV